jgi:hypothetical protein
MLASYIYILPGFYGEIVFVPIVKTRETVASLETKDSWFSYKRREGYGCFLN